MKITISGKPGSGKSSVAKELSRILGLRYHSIGNIMRRMAQRRGMSLLELSKRAEKEKWVDAELDNEQRRLAKSRDFVLDSRLGFHFVPDSIKVYLGVSETEAAKRVFRDVRKIEVENTTLEITRKNLKRREESERLRYRKYYGVDADKKGNFDFIIDTTGLSVEKVVKKIIDFVKRQGQKQDGN